MFEYYYDGELVASIDEKLFGWPEDSFYDEFHDLIWNRLRDRAYNEFAPDLMKDKIDEIWNGHENIRLKADEIKKEIVPLLEKIDLSNIDKAMEIMHKNTKKMDEVLQERLGEDYELYSELNSQEVEYSNDFSDNFFEEIEGRYIWYIDCRGCKWVY